MQKKVELFQDTGRNSLNGKEVKEAKLEIESLEFQPSSREIPGKNFGIGSLRKVWISWSRKVWKSNPEYLGAEQSDKIKDASLCNYLIKVLSNNCGLSCTPKAKGGIRTSVLLDFVQQEESLPCRSTIQGLDFYIGLRKGQLITRQDSPKEWEQNQTLLCGNLSYTTGPGPVRSAEI